MVIRKGLPGDVRGMKECARGQGCWGHGTAGVAAVPPKYCNSLRPAHIWYQELILKKKQTRIRTMEKWLIRFFYSHDSSAPNEHCSLLYTHKHTHSCNFMIVLQARFGTQVTRSRLFKSQTMPMGNIVIIFLSPKDCVFGHRSANGSVVVTSFGTAVWLAAKHVQNESTMLWWPAEGRITYWSQKHWAGRANTHTHKVLRGFKNVD